MPDILHKIGVKSSSPEKVYETLTTCEGLAGWWTNDTTGEPGKVGGIVKFRFGAGGFDMQVVELRSPDFVLWKVIDGPQEWIDTTISWEIKQEGDYTIVLMKHMNWKEPVEFMHHCSTKWAIFLMSMKSLLETGTGAPNPNDVKIDNWN